jgi:hypothetical protein
MTIAVGNIMRLNSGSPKLIVTSVDGDNITVRPEQQVVSDPTGGEQTFKAAMLTHESDYKEPVPQPRKLAGLIAGRIVHYVMLDGAIRSMMIVNPHEGYGPITGLLFFDGIHDRMRHVRPLVAGGSGHAPEFATLIGAVEYSAPVEGEAVKPGTWHWPPKDAVVAKSVDAAALSTQILAVVNDELSKQVAVFREQLTEIMNDKFAAHLESVNELVETVTAPETGGATSFVHDHDGGECTPSCPAYSPAKSIALDNAQVKRFPHLETAKFSGGGKAQEATTAAGASGGATADATGGQQSGEGKIAANDETASNAS